MTKIVTKRVDAFLPQEKPYFLKKHFLRQSFPKILRPILLPQFQFFVEMKYILLWVYRMKRKEQVLTGIYIKTKQLIVSKN